MPTCEWAVDRDSCALMEEIANNIGSNGTRWPISGLDEWMQSRKGL